MKRYAHALIAVAAASALQGADYHVSPRGNNGHPGTEAQPFGTIQKAAEVAQAGDTCHIRAGVYRETVRPAASGQPGKPVRFVAEQGAEVVVSGADVMAAHWSVHRGSIYKAKTDREFIQLFVDGKMMIEARWPNSPKGDLMAMKCATAGAGTGYERLAAPDLPPGDWNAAWVLIWPGSRWTNATRKIVDYRPGEGFGFDRTLEGKRKDKYHREDPYKPKPGNPYILFGSLAGLDAPGEWFLDLATHTVYLWTPDGRPPSEHRVEVKQRACAFNLKQLSHIELYGLRVFGAAVDMSGSRHCLAENCRMEYVDHFREIDKHTTSQPRNVVTGEGNVWRRCLIAYSAGTALRLAGKNNRLENSIVHDADYSGSVACGVNMSGSDGNVMSRCAVFRGGRDLVGHGRAKRIRIEYCDLHHANMLNNDAGATYCWGTDGQGSVIAYNWVHDNMGSHTVGIYLDNFSKNFIVHHNVVWRCSSTGIRLNSDALNHLVCNNTIAMCTRITGTYCYFNHVPTQKGTRIINNLFLGMVTETDPQTFVQGELGPELRCNGRGAITPNGVPTPGSAAVDAGVPVKGVTEGFVGKAPDLGAYERGAAYWTPGPDWGGVQSEMDIEFTPQPPVTETMMITKGLRLWLDANDAATVQVAAAGGVRLWLDKSGSGRHASATDGFTLVTGALNGRSVVRAAGKGNMRVGTIRAQTGPVTAFVVSQNAQAGGSAWQRIVGSWSGDGQEWVAPNWIITRPKAAKVEPYGARLFFKQAFGGLVIDRLTLFGAPSGDHQFLVGDVAEVLVYDRELRFDETAAIQAYLSKKWALQ